MYNVLLTIHILVTFFLIGIILVQRSASDGMGLSSSSSNSFLSGRAAASAVTRTTAILATVFIITSLGLGILTARSHVGEGSIIEHIHAKPAASTPLLPATPPGANPAMPSVPVTEPTKPSVPRPE